MKNRNFIYKLFFALSLSVSLIGCGDDESSGSGVTFNGIASTLFEDNATTTVTVPYRGGSLSEEDVVISGTATAGQDYTFDGITDEGLKFTILEDDKWEINETIVVRIPSSENSTHTVTLVSDCADVVGIVAAPFAGNWSATEFYCGLGVTTGSCDFGPYTVTMTQDAENPNRLHFANFYGTAALKAYIDIDGAAGTVKFPDQDVEGDTSDPELTASSGTYTIDLCAGTGTLVINLNYDGGDWVYQFVRQ